MKVPNSVFARIVVLAGAVAVGIGASAIAQTTPQEADATSGPSHPGRLVESATPNTGMVIPEWDEQASVDSQPQAEPEATIQTDFDDALNHRSGASGSRAIQPPTITSISMSQDDGLHDAVLPRDPERQAPVQVQQDNDSAPESIANPSAEPINPVADNSDRQIDSQEATGANASTVIPRPDIVESTGSGESAVVPRNAIDAPWYRHPAIALFVVVAAIVGVAMVFRKYVPSSRMIPMNAVRVVGRAPISAKHSIALLHVGQRLLVVGMTADRVSTLSEITDPQEVSLLLGATGHAGESAGAFGAALADQIGQFGLGEADGSDGADDLEDRSLLNETKGQLQSLMRRLRSIRAA